MKEIQVFCRGCDKEVEKFEDGFYCKSCEHFCCEPYIKNVDGSRTIIAMEKE